MINIKIALILTNYQFIYMQYTHQNADGSQSFNAYYQYLVLLIRLTKKHCYYETNNVDLVVFI